jgi:hypothetical protein
LSRWVTSIAGDVEVVFDRPRDGAVAKPTVSLLSARARQLAATVAAAASGVSLRYLVPRRRPTLRETHKLLSVSYSRRSNGPTCKST